MKKLFAVLVALTLVLSMGTIAFAAETGSITINNAVEGESYTIYKMFDFAPVAGSTTNGRYTVAAGWQGFLDGEGAAYLELDADANTIKWVGAETAERKAELAKKAVAYAEAHKDTIEGKTIKADGTTVIFSDLELGYYAVDTSLGTICALTTANQDVEVEEKNTQPTVEKKILENGTPVDANNVKIGDTINYQATITAGKGTVNYVLHDTMSKGLTFDGTVVVKNTTDNYTLVAGTDYEFKTPGDCGCTFEIDLTDAYETEKLSEGETIVVTYSAKLNSDAEIGNTGNPNEIVLKYGDAQETTKDYVITYTTKLTINKFEIVDNQKEPLTGAGFTLYKDSVSDDNIIGEEIVGGDITEFVWTGLEAGTYVLVESTIPDGYNGIDPITFTITWAAPDKVENGNATATWESSKPTEIILQDDGTFKGEIENKTGSLLPSTGGIGTTIFYIVGITLMLGAAIVLISKKRMASFA